MCIDVYEPWTRKWTPCHRIISDMRSVQAFIIPQAISPSSISSQYYVSVFSNFPQSVKSPFGIAVSCPVTFFLVMFTVWNLLSFTIGPRDTQCRGLINGVVCKGVEQRGKKCILRYAGLIAVDHQFEEVIL